MSTTYVIVEGAQGAAGDGVDMLQRSSGEAHHQVQPVSGASHLVEVVAGRDGGYPVGPLVMWLGQVWELQSSERVRETRGLLVMVGYTHYYRTHTTHNIVLGWALIGNANPTQHQSGDRPCARRGRDKSSTLSQS